MGVEDLSIFESFPEESYPVVPPLSSLQHRVPLQKIIRDLAGKPGAAHNLAPPGTAVTAEIECFVGVGRRSVLCVLKGKPQVLLCIRNAACSTDDASYCSMLFPPARIAITSGIFRSKPGGESDGFRAIYVACPGAVEFLGIPVEDEPPKKWKAEKRCRHLIDTTNSDYLASFEYVRASLGFSAAMKIAEEAKLDNSLLASSLSEHGFCMHKLGRFEEAMRSCDRALKIDYHLLETLVTKGFALRELQSFKEALVTLQVTKALSATSHDSAYKLSVVNAMVSTLAQLANEQATGEHDVKDYILNGFDPSQPPQWADFTSEAIEIRMTGDGRGRGIFLTRDVKLGELLMVSNPLLLGSSVEDVQVEAIRACGWPSRARRALKLLQDPGSEELPLPGVGDFGFNRSLSGGDEAIDVKRIERVVKQASMLRVRIHSPRTGQRFSKQVFGLPSLINHSCLPNSGYVGLGSALFIRAATSIRAGEEITINYIDCLQPLAYRSRVLSEEFAFRCSCRRCEVERRHEEELRLIPEIWTTMPGEEMLLELLAAVVEELESRLAEWSEMAEEERRMIRLGYIEAYMEVYKNRERVESCREVYSKFRDLLSEIEAMKVVREFAPGSSQGIGVISRMVREHVLRLEWHPSFEVEFDDAITTLIGNIVLPSEDYLILLDTFHHGGRFQR